MLEMMILISFLVFTCACSLMAVGVMLKRASIKGSCGGLANLGIERECDCEDPCEEHRLYQISEPAPSNDTSPKHQHN